MKFSKWHGQGNDFVIVNGFEEKIADYSTAAQKVCHRNFGIGADGLVVILPSEIADFKMVIFNSDGSPAEMCGNATRCVARYVYERKMTNKTAIRLETLAGIIIPELVFEGNELKTIRVDMGEPRLKREQIPMSGNPAEQVVDLPISVDGQEYRITVASMGNPHCVIFVNELKAVDLSHVGPKIETNPLFPRKTNVEFIEVLNRKEIKMRVWERGAGITLACGTGACASTVACVLNEKTDRAITIHLDGGDLSVEWGTDNHLYMSGPAIEVYNGEYLHF